MVKRRKFDKRTAEDIKRKLEAIAERHYADVQKLDSLLAFEWLMSLSAWQEFWQEYAE